MIAAINKTYRFFFCRGGYGVHSPFVFDLITNVIEDKYGYYCYEKLSIARKQLIHDSSKIKCNNRSYTVNEVLWKFCFSKHESQLLFRLANHFQLSSIYLIGCDLGLAPLYLTSWSGATQCVIFEPKPESASVAQKIIDKYSTASVEIRNTFNPEDAKNSELIVWGKLFCNICDDERSNYITFSIETFNQLLTFINNNSIMVISGINASKKNKDTWKNVCAAPEVTVTIDLYNLGIVFFNPKLNKKTYKSFVL